MSPQDLALAAQYPNGTVSYATVQELTALGYPVTATPLPNMPFHATVVTGGPLSPDQAAALSAAFANKFPNPARGRNGGSVAVR